MCCANWGGNWTMKGRWRNWKHSLYPGWGSLHQWGEDKEDTGRGNPEDDAAILFCVCWREVHPGAQVGHKSRILRFRLRSFWRAGDERMGRAWDGRKYSFSICWWQTQGGMKGYLWRLPMAPWRMRPGKPKVPFSSFPFRPWHRLRAWGAGTRSNSLWAFCLCLFGIRHVQFSSLPPHQTLPICQTHTVKKGWSESWS